LDEKVMQYNNTKHSSLNDTPNNRYEQNPNRGVFTVPECKDEKYVHVRQSTATVAQMKGKESV
jgi:hypothetical protein